MGSRPIIGVTPSEQQGESVPAPAASPTSLPLATELPNWDLLPSDTLLVRRRPASK